jgi:uncharacterized protein (DUF697 family)
MTEYTAVPTAEVKEAQALAIVRADVGWSAGAGLLPVPGVDIAAIIGVQVKMLQSIANVYEVPFRTNLVRPLIVALLSSGSAVMAGAVAASLLKGLPVIGSLVGMLSLPAFASASCWATGKVFIRHFESGGTFLDFDPAKARAYYSEQFAAAKTAT